MGRYRVSRARTMPHFDKRGVPKFDVDAASGCWNWKGYIAPNGYGKVFWRGRMWVAHRIIYAVLIEEVRLGMDLDHLCRNRRCVNPGHLEPVSRSENAHRGRGCKLSSAVVNEIRKRCAEGESQSAVARSFGLHSSTVNRIVHFDLWRVVGMQERLLRDGVLA